jgi:hypothetical protein
MLLDSYEKDQQLYNSNFKESAGAGWYAYRGDLVVVDGEIADAQGRRMPPVVGLIGAVMLTESDKIKLLAGSLDDLADIKPLLGKYQAALAPDARVLIYVVNVAKPMIAKHDGHDFVLIPMTDGMVWNELIDELALEKSDFKGQGAGEKVRTLYDAFSSYKPKYETVSLDEAIARKTDAKRENRGPV